MQMTFNMDRLRKCGAHSNAVRHTSSYLNTILTVMNGWRSLKSMFIHGLGLGPAQDFS
jgi:hypothetical protein